MEKPIWPIAAVERILLIPTESFVVRGKTYGETRQIGYHFRNQNRYLSGDTSKQVARFGQKMVDCHRLHIQENTRRQICKICGKRLLFFSGFWSLHTPYDRNLITFVTT